MSLIKKKKGKFLVERKSLIKPEDNFNRNKKKEKMEVEKKEKWTKGKKEC